MTDKEKKYVFDYMKVYLIFVGIVFVIGFIGSVFFNLELQGLIIFFLFVSIGMIIGLFFEKKRLKNR